MVKDLAFVTYPVADVARAVAFYRDVVGLSPGDSFGDRWVEFNVGPTAFALTRGEAVGLKAGTQFSVALEVDDINAMHRRLKDKGVEVSDVFESPSCFGCFVTDPDGNRFGLHQRKAQSLRGPK
jgi:predicted enzyme related to lactoylglutathione lyase